MRKGITLPISDIRPNTNIESEIFPQQLTREAQTKDVFTPPGHPQMRFSGPEDRARQQAQQQQQAAQQDDGSGFFITEDVRDDNLFPIDGVDEIQEEKSYGSETANERQISKHQMMAAGIEGEDREGQQPHSHEELGETEPQGDEDPRQ